ncbi:MAG TPA: enoyl-CoA hydratase/isomerase family protein [Candidatus Sulfotelmatobacter sp.]|nr:enoyl-CoA hydratase/isomerase family protein [Candidatus Sulfotelmatobacter sp.]
MLNCSIQKGVAWLTLQRPEVLNAINDALATEFDSILRELERRQDVRVVVTRGEGRAFCAGSDLRELAPLNAADAANYELRFAEIFSGLDRLPQPTIAAIHGHALGGGLGLALYHDFRIASETASIGMPEVELGWLPPWAVGRLADAVGLSHARWILMTCKTMTGAEAAEIGLVNEAVPEGQLISRTEELARRLAAMPPEGLTQTRKLLQQMSPWRQFEWDKAAAEMFRLCYEKPEAQKRIADFVNKKRKS